MNNMKVILHFFKITLLLLASVVSTHIITAGDIQNENISDGKAIEKPKMFFEEQVYDFGKIYIGESIKHEFKLKNLGKGELVINNVKSSCGCTAALVSKNILLKDEEGEVEVKFNSGHYVGKVTKSVIVNSKRINFGIIRKGDSCTKNMEIKTV